MRFCTLVLSCLRSGGPPFHCRLLVLPVCWICLSLPCAGNAAELTLFQWLRCSCFQIFDTRSSSLLQAGSESPRPVERRHVCCKTPEVYHSGLEAGRQRNTCGSVKVTAFMTFLSPVEWGMVNGMKSLQEEKGSFLQILLCIGTKSVDNILTKLLLLFSVLFYLLFFLLVLTYMWLWEKVYKR